MIISVVDLASIENRNSDRDVVLSHFLSRVNLLGHTLLKLPLNVVGDDEYFNWLLNLMPQGSFDAQGFKVDDDEVVTKLLDSGLHVAFFNLTDEKNILLKVITSLPRIRVGIYVEQISSVDQMNHIVKEYREIVGHFTFRCSSYDTSLMKTAKDLISGSGFSIQIYLELPTNTPDSILVTFATYMDGLHITLPVSIRDSSNVSNQILRNPYISWDQEGVCEPDIVSLFVSCLRSDRPDKLFTTVVCDEHGVCLGLVYSNEESIRVAIVEKRGVYWSRSRASLWRKGDSSGMQQDLLQVKMDCDHDALRFTVIQRGNPPAFCHLMTRTCWGQVSGVKKLETILFDRKKAAPEGSYTKRLFDDPDLLRRKLLEEVQELVEAEEPDHIAAEAADVLYFTLTRCVAAGVGLSDIERHLDQRTLKVTRRPGNAKAWRTQAAEAILAESAKKNAEEKPSHTESAK